MNAQKNPVEGAILKTLAYRSVFNYPLTIHQLGTTLITITKIEYKALEKNLEKLEGQKLIKKKDGKYFLAAVKPLSWKLRTLQSKKTLKESDPVFSILKKIPWIKMLAVTGSVAAFNTDKKDDIDIFIIASRNRMLITRFFVVLLLKAAGKYRVDKNPSQKICPNIYIDESLLAWDKTKRNVYVAHEILMMRPIINKDEMYFRFIKANSWVFDFFANYKIEHYSLDNLKKKVKPSRIVNLLEKVLMQLQVSYMKRKRTEEVATKTIIHFNKNDWTDKIIKEYRGMLKKYANN